MSDKRIVKSSDGRSKHTREGKRYNPHVKSWQPITTRILADIDRIRETGVEVLKARAIVLATTRIDRTQRPLR